MQLLGAVHTYGSKAYRWCEELSLVQKIVLAVVFAGMIALAAQVRIPVPGSPVPLTGQTFAVLLAGVMLGRSWGGLSVGMYAGAGALGAPVFAGMAGGLAYLAGPTGGYVLGFVAAAMLVGYAVRTYPQLQNPFGILGLMLFANFVVIHGLGLLHLGFLTGMPIGQLFWIGTVPFILVDLIKVVGAAAVALALLPQK